MTEIYADDVDWQATARDLAGRLKAVEKLHYAIDDGACAHCDDMFKHPCLTIKAARGE